MIDEILKKLTNKEDLSYDEAKSVMDKIMVGELTDAQIASYLTALKMKGEAIDEITASATSMRDKGLKIETDFDTIDIVGTGGDQTFSFNISTISAFVVSSLGIKVAKHGNRSVSSKCGAADLLEALGVNLNISNEQSLEILKNINLCFMFAQKYHSSMRYVGHVRKELGVRTIFNILGPLSNPASSNQMLLGVYSKDLVIPLANVLNKLGVKRALVVYGMDGMDEITLTDDTYICELRDGKTRPYLFNPEDYGFKKCNKEDLVGGSVMDNKQIALDILNGALGPKRDAVVLNSAMALFIALNNTSLEDCIIKAKMAIDSKLALKQMKRFVELTNDIR